MEKMNNGMTAYRQDSSVRYKDEESNQILSVRDSNSNCVNP